MKRFLLLLSLFSFSFGFSQSLPINFEAAITTSDFIDFDGGTANVIANPFPTGINTSDSVARIVRDGGAIWSGSKIALAANLDFSVLTKLSMKVYTTAPVGTTVKFKLEGVGAATEVDSYTTTTGEWETLEWVFAGTPNTMNEVVFMFDFGNVGNGTAGSTFYFDDVEQIAGPPAPTLISIPIDFESGVTSSDFLDFSGATASVIANPQMGGINTSSTVGQVVRDGGEFWAGSRVLLDNNIDLSSMWHISMKVFTDAPIGTRVKLELGGQNGATSIDVLTTVTGAWETLSWNFNNQTNSFNEMIFQFDFGNVGNGSATSTFLFDDVQQFVGPALPTPLPATLPIDFESSVVSSDFTNFFGATTTVIPNPQMTGINTSPTVAKILRSGGQAWAQSKLVLTDSMDFSTLVAISMKVYSDAPIGTILKLKVESTGSGAANERDAILTASGEWVTYTFEFAGDPPVYNVLTFMFGYASVNDASSTATFLVDDIQQTSDLGTASIDPISSTITYAVYPNPANNAMTFTSANSNISSISLFDVLGNEVSVVETNSPQVTLNVTDFANGIYIARVSNDQNSEVSTIKLMIDHE